MFEEDKIIDKIEDLEEEHRALDHTIDHLRRESTVSDLQLQRLKKRKLAIRDEIAYLNAFIHPDIPA